MLRLLILIPCVLFAAPWIAKREPIDPYISGDTFRAHADFAYDEISKDLQPKAVFSKSTVFVNGDILGEFLEKVHPLISQPYILIVHNTDHSIPGPYLPYLEDPKIIALFTQNPDDSGHPKIRPLPIGIENRQWNRWNWEFLKKCAEQKFKKSYLLYSNFCKDTFPSERTLVLEKFAKTPFTVTATRKPYESFVRDLAISKFVLSPRGNGLDCHRTWEALYAGSYPIVRSSPLDPLFEGLPVLIVQNWDELTEAFLEEKYQEFSQKQDYNWEKIYIDYYLAQIEEAKK